MHAKAPGNFGNLLAPGVRHQADGRVVEVGGAHQRGHPLVAADVLEMLRVDALAVHLQAFEGEAEHL
ncbi:hypothetical protein D3C81_1236090 [compost metagenome]